MNWTPLCTNKHKQHNFISIHVYVCICGFCSWLVCSVHGEFDYLFPPVFHGLLSGLNFIEYIIFSYYKILHPICNRELYICDYQSLIITIQSNSSWDINNYLYKKKIVFTLSPGNLESPQFLYLSSVLWCPL
jgi:hypothetical protein